MNGEGALTNGNQRKTALAVALAAGITTEQYVALTNAVTEHHVSSFGETASERQATMRRQIRAGIIHRQNIDAILRHACAGVPVRTRTDDVGVQLRRVLALLVNFAGRVDDLSPVEANVVNQMHDVYVSTVQPIQ